MPDNGNSRIDRIEERLKKLTAVVGKLAGVVVSLAEGQQRLQTAQIETTGKLNALIRIFTSLMNGYATGPIQARS